MPMTLEEAKKRAYEIYMTQVSHMNSVIEDYEKDPSSLRPTGHKDIGAFLVSTVKYTAKQADKVFKQYERENPDG